MIPVSDAASIGTVSTKNVVAEYDPVIAARMDASCEDDGALRSDELPSVESTLSCAVAATGADVPTMACVSEEVLVAQTESRDDGVENHASDQACPTPPRSRPMMTSTAADGTACNHEASHTEEEAHDLKKASTTSVSSPSAPAPSSSSSPSETQAIIERPPPPFEALLDSGRRAMQENRWRDAAQCFEVYIQKLEQMDCIDATSFSMDSEADASADCELHFSSDDMMQRLCDAYQFLGLSFLNTSQKDEAIKAFRRCLRLRLLYSFDTMVVETLIGSMLMASGVSISVDALSRITASSAKHERKGDALLLQSKVERHYAQDVAGASQIAPHVQTALRAIQEFRSALHLEECISKFVRVGMMQASVSSESRKNGAKDIKDKQENGDKLEDKNQHEHCQQQHPQQQQQQQQKHCSSHDETENEDKPPPSLVEETIDEANIRCKLASAYMVVNEPSKAFAEYRSSLRIYTNHSIVQLDDVETAACTRRCVQGILASALLMGCDAGDAEAYLDATMIALVQESMGDDCTKMGNTEQALQHYGFAVQLEEMGIGRKQLGLAYLHTKVANLHERRDDLQQAMSCHCHALAMYEPLLGSVHRSTRLTKRKIKHLMLRLREAKGAGCK